MRVGIVGVRGFGASYFTTLAARTDVEVIAVCGRDRAALDRIAAVHRVPHCVTDYRDLVTRPDLDAVFVATPHVLHYPITMAALRAGKHVFCEKPLALRGDQAREMACTARERGLVLTCHYNERETTHIRTLRAIVQAGWLGAVYHASVRWMARWTGFMFDARREWRRDVDQAGGGILIGRGSHLIDAIWYTLGRPRIRSVCAATHARVAGFEVDDLATIRLRLEGGATADIQCSYVAHLTRAPRLLEYELFGTEGGASYAADDGRVRVGRCDVRDGRWEDREPASTRDLAAIESTPPVSLIEEFLDAVADGRGGRGGRALTVTAEDAAYVTAVLEAAYESARAEREMRLAPDGVIA